MGGGKGVMKDMIKIHHIHEEIYHNRTHYVSIYADSKVFKEKKNSPTPKGREESTGASHPEEQCLVLTQTNQGG